MKVSVHKGLAVKTNKKIGPSPQIALFENTAHSNPIQGAREVG